MNPMTFVLVSAGLLALCGAARTLVRSVRGPRPEVGLSLGKMGSPVRVLRSDDELQETIGRALGYDYVAEEALHRRIDRYTRSDTPNAATAIDLPTRGPCDTRGADRRKVTV